MNKDDLEILNNLMQKYNLVEIIDGLETLCIERAEYEAVKLGDITLAKQWMFHSTLLKMFNAELKGDK